MASSLAFRFTCSTRLHQVALCMVAAVALAAPGCVEPAAPGDGDTAETAQAAAVVSELCDAFGPSGSHSTIAVPSGSTITTCSNFAGSLVLPDFRLGCQFDDGTFSFGLPHARRFGASLPQPNCGWTCVREPTTPCIAGQCHCGRAVRPLDGEFTCEGRCIATEVCSDICGI